jgi:hypothetical protein
LKSVDLLGRGVPAGRSVEAALNRGAVLNVTGVTQICHAGGEGMCHELFGVAA